MSDRRTEDEVFHEIRFERTFDIRALINAYHFPTKPAFEPHLETYDFSQIIYVTEGEGIYTTEDGAYPFGAGMIFYRPARKASKYEWTSDEASLAVISFVCPSPAMQAFERPPFSLCEEESAMLLDLMKTGARIFEYVKRGQGERGMQLRADVPPVALHFVVASLERFLSMVYCRLCDIRLLTDESQKSNRYIDESRLVDEVKRYLADRISDALTVSDICAHFGLCKTALCRKFKRATGQSLMDYFNDQKIARAKHLIRTEGKSFTEISDALAFSSVNYFSKVFKAHVGVTPTEFSRFVSKRRGSAT